MDTFIFDQKVAETKALNFIKNKHVEDRCTCAYASVCLWNNYLSKNETLFNKHEADFKKCLQSVCNIKEEKGHWCICRKEKAYKGVCLANHFTKKIHI